jgi:succinate-acetate transporter protein
LQAAIKLVAILVTEPKPSEYKETWMLFLLIISLTFSVVTLILLAVYFITGAKNTPLMRVAGACGIVSSLLWIIQSRMR